MKRERQTGQGTTPARALFAASRGHPAPWTTGSSPTNFQGKLTWDWVSQVRSRHSEGKKSNRAPSCYRLSDHLTPCPSVLSLSWFWPLALCCSFCLFVFVRLRPLSLLSLLGKLRCWMSGGPLALMPCSPYQLPGPHGHSLSRQSSPKVRGT